MTKQRANYIADMNEYNEWKCKADNMQSAYEKWSTAKPESVERATFWENYVYLRDKFEEFKRKIEARGFH